MKKAYKKPAVKYVDYSYQEQVVATSPGEFFSGTGDGNQLGFCTWLSGSTVTPCTENVGGGNPLCEEQKWKMIH
ncbi:MAG: hypothetical protein E7336_10850 [Clostridiales bacterium]|nr:hypothetical protein [Clostridiales bacterium]